MSSAQQRNYAKSYLAKAQEYLASAEANLDAGRYTPAAGDAIHAGISAKDSVVTVRTGATRKGKDHSTAAKELRQALGKHPEAASAGKSLGELLAAKSAVEYGVALVTATKAEPLVRRARVLVQIASQIVQLGR